MFGFQIPTLDRFGDARVQRFAFQIIVDVLVGDTQGHFIRQGGAIVFQVGGGQLLIQMFRAVEMGQQLFALTFVQAENWVDVGAAVAIFGEKAGNRFRRMVGTDHNSFGHSGDAVLGLHSLTGFFISANEVAQFDACFAQRLFAGQHRSFNIDCQHPVRLDKCDGVLAVLLISLHAIG